MKKFLQASVAIMCLCVSAFFGASIYYEHRAAVQLGNLANDAHVTLTNTNGVLSSVKGIEKSTSDMLEATYASEGSIANLADTINGIADDLRQHEDAELKAAQDSSEKLSKLLEGASVVIQTVNDTAKQTGQDIHDTLTASQGTLNAATNDLNDAAIKQSLDNIAAATHAFSDTSVQLDKTMTDGRVIADHYTTKILAPATKSEKAVAAARLAAKIIGDLIKF